MSEGTAHPSTSLLNRRMTILRFLHPADVMMSSVTLAFLYREVSEAYFTLHAESNSILACLLILSGMCLI